MPNVPTISLKSAPIQFAAFNPIEYKQVEQDNSILRNSLLAQENRHNNAVEQQSAVDAALSDIQSKLHNDKETQQWFSNYKNDIQNQIQDQVDRGNYGNAFRTAVRLAKGVTVDPAVNGRIKAEATFQNEIKTQQTRMNNHEISKETYDWWLSQNPYKYEDNYDADGNIIGGTDYSPEFRPVDDINYANLAKVAFSLISPNKSTINNSWNNGDSETGESKGGRNNFSREWITPDMILKNIKELVTALPEGQRQIEQSYDVYRYSFDKLNKQYEESFAKDPTSDTTNTLGQQLEERKRLMYKNGSPISYDEFFARMISENAFAEGLSYDWKVKDTSSTNIKGSDNDNNGNTKYTRATSNIYQPGYTYDVNKGLWVGPLVRQTTESDKVQEGVADAQHSVNDRFGN